MVVLIGDGTRADELLTALDLDSLDPESIDIETAALIFRAAQRNWSLGNGDEAMADYELLLQVFTRLGREREVAVTMGQIADIYEARGDLDAAMRIRTEEQLPVYERLGDVRSKAVTMSKIADIYYHRGDLDDALRIRTEEQLPVYERLGDVRSKAVTMGKIADIYYHRGDLDDALRIRTEEQLPVFDRLGDVREKAVTMGKIADIYEARGDLDAALRIRTEEQLPVFDRLGDVREKAVTLNKIAQGLISSGGLNRGKGQEIFDAVAEAFVITRNLDEAVGIGHNGLLLGQLLAASGRKKEARDVLSIARAAFARIDESQGEQAIDQILNEIGDAE